MATTKSIYLNSQPEYLALLGQTKPIARSYGVDRDTAVLVTMINGKPIHNTGEISISALLSRDEEVTAYWDHRYSLKQFIIYNRYRRGKRRSVKVPVETPPTRRLPGAGRIQVPTGGSSPQYPDAVRKGRAGVGTRLRSPAAARTKTPQSSTLRPSPEQTFKAFISVQETNFSPSISTPPLITPESRLVWRRTWTGVRTPGFGKLKKKQLPVNPHTVLIEEFPVGFVYIYNRRILPTGGDPNVRDYSVSVRKYADVIAVPAVPGHLSQARNKALARLRDKAEVEIEANLFQDFAQVGQTMRLLNTNVKRITSSVNNLRKGNILGAVSALTAGRSRVEGRKGRPSRTKDLAENWLELQYGWKPLLHDIYGTFKALSKLQTGDPFVQQVTSSASAQSESTTSFVYPATFPPSSHSIRVQTRCKVQVRFTIHSPLKAFLAQTGFTNPMNLAWEILPFSFVVDWFLPIGPYLEALTAWDGMSFLDGSETNFTESWTDSSVNYVGVTPGNSTTFNENHGLYARNTISLGRVKLIAFPNPSLPSFKNGLDSVERAKNALSLLRAAFK